MNNILKKIALIIGIFGLFLLINKNIYALAEEQLEETTTESLIVGKESPRYGLMGYYFEDANFSRPILVAPTGKKGLSYEKADAKDLISEQQLFRSYRWMGYIYSDTTKDVSLQLVEVDDFIIEVDGTIVSKPGELSTVHLEKDTLLEVKIEARSSGDDTVEKLQTIKLVSNEDGKTNEIKAKQFRSADSSQEKWQKKIVQASTKNLFGISPYDDKSTKDTDGDNIYDDWEINGYTIQNKVAVPWKEEYAEKGYTKFVSNPLEAHTAGDPYSDYEKAAQDMPANNDNSVYNPLVAAYPSVNVNLEKVILSKNEDLSHSVSSSHSTSWSHSTGLDVAANAGWQGLGPSIGVSSTYHNTTTTGTEWGHSEDDSSHINSAESAYLNANVRYNNVGTGAIYNVRPTTSFVLGDTTIGTIKAKDNTEALRIIPKESYPKQSQNGIAINTMDDFNSRPIPLNKDQLANFISNKEAIRLETNQVAGKYAIKDVHGNIVIQGDWNGIQDQIDAVTASIIIDSGDTIAERKVAAKNYSNPEDLTPEVTLKEALKISFPDEITEKKDRMFYKDKPIYEESIIKYIDEFTSKEIEKQLNDNTGKFKDVHTLYDVKLIPKMNITLKLPVVYDGVDDGETFDWWRCQKVNGGNTGDYCYTTTSYMILASLNNKILLDKNADYYLSVYIKDETGIPLQIGVESGNMALQGVEFVMNPTDQYERVLVPFTNPENNPVTAVRFNSREGSKLCVDDISIIKRFSSKVN